MYFFKRIKNNTNASLIKRTMAFTIDIMFANMVRVFLFYTLVNFKSKSIILDFVESFKKYFPEFSMTNIKDYEIRYIVESQMFLEIFYIICIFAFAGVVYNLLNYCLFKNATIGQKIMSLKTINNNEDKTELNFIQKIGRSIFNAFPYNIMFLLTVALFFNHLGFHLYAPKTDFLRAFIVNIISFASANNLSILAIFFIFVWLNAYLFTNKFVLHDIITHTRVVDKTLIIQNEIDEKSKKDIVYYVDSVILFLKNINSKMFNFIKNKIKRK